MDLRGETIRVISASPDLEFGENSVDCLFCLMFVSVLWGPEE